MYRATTRSIRVTAEPVYLAERSVPDENQYFWAYHIEIANLGAVAVQLISRHWRITDANGLTEEVHGLGVIGEQPRLEPGAAFEYTSGVPLRTDTGIMAGTYLMEAEGGERFEVDIPAFSLDSPDANTSVN
jgi:ApaG protein